MAGLIVKIEGPIGFGPYRHRQAFLEGLWNESEKMMDQFIEEGKVPADQPGFTQWRMRLRAARYKHCFLKKRYPSETENMLRNLGTAFGLR